LRGKKNARRRESQREKSENRFLRSLSGRKLLPQAIGEGIPLLTAVCGIEEEKVKIRKTKRSRKR